MNIPWHIRCAALQTLYTAGHKVELVVGFSDLSDPLDTVAVCGSAEENKTASKDNMLSQK